MTAPRTAAESFNVRYICPEEARDTLETSPPTQTEVKRPSNTARTSRVRAETVRTSVGFGGTRAAIRGRPRSARGARPGESGRLAGHEAPLSGRADRYTDGLPIP